MDFSYFQHLNRDHTVICHKTPIALLAKDGVPMKMKWYAKCELEPCSFRMLGVPYSDIAVVARQLLQHMCDAGHL
jgi:hypothetical protein